MSSTVLALETSTSLLGVSIISRGKVLYEVSLEKPKAHSSMLLPTCMDAIDVTGIGPGDINCIAVSGGPGSFTGLRIGAATAQGLAYSWDIPVVMVPSFYVYLYQARHAANVVIASGKAKAQAVFGFYQNKPGAKNDDFWGYCGFTEAVPAGPYDAASFLGDLRGICKDPIFVTGDGAEALIKVAKSEQSLDDLSARLALLDYYWIHPKAGVLGLIGDHMYQRGFFASAQEAIPDYVRKSQAEARKRMGETIWKS